LLLQNTHTNTHTLAHARKHTHIECFLFATTSSAQAHTQTNTRNRTHTRTRAVMCCLSCVITSYGPRIYKKAPMLSFLCVTLSLLPTSFVSRSLMLSLSYFNTQAVAVFTSLLLSVFDSVIVFSCSLSPPSLLFSCAFHSFPSYSLLLSCSCVLQRDLCCLHSSSFSFFL